MVQIICGGEFDDLRKDGVFTSLNEKNESRYWSEDPPLAIQETDDRYLVFETSNPVNGSFAFGAVRDRRGSAASLILRRG